MKIKDYDVFGQMLAAFTGVVNFCKDRARTLDARPDMLVWLTEGPGIKALNAAIDSVVAAWKLDCQSTDRRNQLKLSGRDFKSLVSACRFGGKNIDVNVENFPSLSRRWDASLIFQEVAFAREIPAGGEAVALADKDLRPAEPLEFLEWLAHNPEAGILTSIHCVAIGHQGNYIMSGLCGGGDRGLHMSSPRDHGDAGKHWPVATVFLGVKI